MSDMGFYSLPTGKLRKKPRQNRLKNFPAGYVGSFYRSFANNIDNFIGSDFYGRIAKDQIYYQRTYKNTSLQPPILPEAFRLTLVITSHETELNETIIILFELLNFLHLMVKIGDLSNLSDLRQNVMTNNSLSTHVESGDIFYQNYNTGENL